MDTQNVIKNAEASIALAKLVEALRPITSCTVRRSDTPMSTSCELVLRAPNETAAQALHTAIEAASKHL